MRRFKIKEIIRLIEKDGWWRVKAKGGHRQYKHPTKPGRVTISGPNTDTLAPKTAQSILRQAGLSLMED
ncbi:MAG: type II toxin-antitoxin system HicA family toxin [Nitrospinae bacterium]|nr:type II toxin-antitoxin system HicA family toxin [Nitrospinota bacterium]